MDGTANPGTGAGGGGAGDLAAAALKAAQQAVANLKLDTSAAAAPSPSNESDSAGDGDMMAAAQAAIAAAKLMSDSGGQGFGGGSPSPSPAPAAPPMGSRPMAMPEFGAPPPQKVPEGIDLLADVNLNVKIELGRTRMLVEDVLRLGQGSVVELDKLAGDPVDVYVNERHVARGEVLVLNDNFCVRINEIVTNASDAGRGRASGV